MYSIGSYSCRYLDFHSCITNEANEYVNSSFNSVTASVRSRGLMKIRTNVLNFHYKGVSSTHTDFAYLYNRSLVDFSLISMVKGTGTSIS